MNALAQAPFELGCGFGQPLTVDRHAAAISGCGIVARPHASESFCRIERNIVSVRPKSVTSCRRARIKPSHRFEAVPLCALQMISRTRAGECCSNRSYV
jgi:hypothetical protein